MLVKKGSVTVTPKPDVQPAGVGDPVLEPATVLQGQVGLVDIEPATALLGAAGYHEGNRAEMPRLVGSSLATANAYMREKGAPPLSAYSGHWGATHFNMSS